MPEHTTGSGSCASPCSAFDAWWNDMDNGCPQLVLNNDEQFARAVWGSAIRATIEQMVTTDNETKEDFIHRVRSLLQATH